MIGFEPRWWLSQPKNIMLTDGENVALFDYYSDGVYTGHYFFKARGREAITIGKRMLDFFFSNTDIKIIRGLTPLSKRHACWMSRQLGFQSYGVVDTIDEPHEVFIMTRNKNG